MKYKKTISALAHEINRFWQYYQHNYTSYLRLCCPFSRNHASSFTV